MANPFNNTYKSPYANIGQNKDNPLTKAIASITQPKPMSTNPMTVALNKATTSPAQALGIKPPNMSLASGNEGPGKNNMFPAASTTPQVKPSTVTTQPATGASTGASVNNPVPTSAVTSNQPGSMAQYVPGTPGYYANNIEQTAGQIGNLQKEYGIRGNAPLQDFNVGNAAGNVSQYNTGLLAAQSAPLQTKLEAEKGLLSASLPGQISPGVTAYNPITGQPVGGSLGDMSGRAAQGANAQLIPQYLNEYNQAKTTLDNISKNEQLFNTFLSTANVNPSSLTPINDLLKTLGGKVSSSDYANFTNLVNSLRSSYAGILASKGLNPVDATTKANGNIPDNASISTIKDVLNYLKQEGGNYLSSKQSQYQNALSGVNGGSSNSNDPLGIL